MSQIQTPTVAAQARLKMSMVSPQKCRLVADLVRGKSLESANRILLLQRLKSAKLILKLLRSAMANAQDKGTADLERLYVSEIFVDEGPRVKRFMPRAQGRADQRIKRTSHVTIKLAESTVAQKAKAAKPAAKKTTKKTTKKATKKAGTKKSPAKTKAGK